MKFSEKDLERRIDSRTAYSGHIFFATKNRVFEGELKNFSQHGLFIKTHEYLKLGEFITIALPYKNSKIEKVKGQIIWKNLDGYGVELVKKRNGESCKLIRIEARSILKSLRG